MTKIFDEPEKDFYGRADAHIHLSNDQARNANVGNVSASMLFGTARYNAYAAACTYANNSEFSTDKDKVIENLVDQYRKMLTKNVTDYLSNFDTYIEVKSDE